MFVDYSGLQRFSIINKCFADRYLHLLYFESVDTCESKLAQLKEYDRTIACIQLLRLEDFRNNYMIINHLFKLSICIEQMREVAVLIRRCPTLYVVELFDHSLADNHCVAGSTGSLAVACERLQTTYNSIRSILLEDIKRTIVELKPSPDFTSFQDWHILQRCLFYEYCTNIPKFVTPKTDIVIIPMAFPKQYAEKVNGDGFMSTKTKLRFYKFDLDSSRRSPQSIQRESLALKQVSNKISTIWKDGDDKDYIGTLWGSDCFKEIIPAHSSCGEMREPNLLNLFREHELNVDGAQCASDFKSYQQIGRSVHRKENITTARKHKSYVHSELESLSTAKTNPSLYDIFSPLSSNNLPTALTPENFTNSTLGHKKYTIQDQAQLPNNFVLPPPPSLLATYDDFEVSTSNSNSHWFRYKLKNLISRADNKAVAAPITSSNGFDTIGSFAEFQSPTWNEMSSKKFIKFKLKKWKGNYHYYTGIAKYCIDDFHSNNVSQHS